jgi:undecaprenyl-diphosphatase
VQAVLTLLQQLPPVLVYLTAALIVAGETAVILGLLVPGEGTLLLVGVLSYTGTLRLVPAMVIMITAAVLGDALAFRSGRRHGPRVRASRWGVRVGEARWGKADAMLSRLGGRGVFAARWVAFARTLVPRLAGSAGMPYRRFAPWNLAGVVTWVGGSVLVGYLAGTSYAKVSQYLNQATGAVLVLLVLIVVIVLVGRWLGRNPDPVRALLVRARALPPVRWLLSRYGALFSALSMQIGPAWALLINLGTALALLFAIGLALARLLGAVVSQSGLSLVDHVLAAWLTQQRTAGMVDVALGAIGVLRGPFLIIVVGLVAGVLGWRTRAWRGDLVSVVGSVGAFVPLVVLALVADVSQPDERASAGHPPATLFPSQIAVATASLCTLAWLLARRTRWPVAVAAWTGAAVGVVTVCGARLYVGWTSVSETVASVLLGGLWTAVFMVAWATRARAVSTGPSARVAPDLAATPDPPVVPDLPVPSDRSVHPDLAATSGPPAAGHAHPAPDARRSGGRSTPPPRPAVHG